MSDPRSHLWNAISKGDIKLVRALLEGGEINVNDPSVPGEGGADPPGSSTFLCHACDVGKLDIVELLVEKGASLNLQEGNLSKEYPLWYATRSGNLVLARFLVGKGANVRQTNANGTTPLHKAMEVGDRDASLELTELFLGHGAEADAKNRWGNTPAHLAARCNNVDALRALIARGADITCKNNDGNTVYDRALHYGSEAIRDFILRRAAGRISRPGRPASPPSSNDIPDGEMTPSTLKTQIDELQETNKRLLNTTNSQEKRLKELQENFSDLRTEMAEIRNAVFGLGAQLSGGSGATATPMSDGHKKILRSHHIKIIQDMQPKGVIDYLYQENVLDDQLQADVKAQSTRQDTNKKLLEIVPTRGDRAFFVFRHGLIKTGQQHIADMLEERTES
ncbi:ANKRD1 [Branchiostoma lanceolatum]|uniref:ANKRD1 protein n=1 Tax=Branchiostoma lanceolatum TaxID=7740 RepID=A0A8J9ZE95_BRALA|nr:ANKRD1 [Branchiostoma lanceolatum]